MPSKYEMSHEERQEQSSASTKARLINSGVPEDTIDNVAHTRRALAEAMQMIGQRARLQDGLRNDPALGRYARGDVVGENAMRPIGGPQHPNPGVRPILHDPYPEEMALREVQAFNEDHPDNMNAIRVQVQANWYHRGMYGAAPPQRELRPGAVVQVYDYYTRQVEADDLVEFAHPDHQPIPVEPEDLYPDPDEPTPQETMIDMLKRGTCE
jgi:hypothetical protein